MTALTHHAYPLSPLQQGLLAHFAGNSAEGVDVVQIVMHLPEALAPRAFAQAWHWLARRHAILRTTFDAGDSHRPPSQEVQPDFQPDFTWHDWRGLPADERGAAWDRLMADDRARGIDPTKLPLWRITVAQFSDQDHRVLFTFHHLLIDARALLVMFPELFDATAAFQAGGEPAGGEVRPYRDYIDWLQAQDAAPALEFWRQNLAGFQTPTPLPLARMAGRAGGRAVAGAHHRVVRLDAARTTALKEFARANGVTMNTLVQGAWALLLGRCSGEPEVVFGAVRACRHASVPGAENLAGPMINTVPLRVALPAGVRVADWLRTLRHQWVEMRPHEHVALSAIRPWTDVPAGTPLFDTVVSYQEPAWDDALAALGGAWAARRFDVHNQLNHPLALDAAGGPTLQLRISFDPAHFSPASIDRMLGHCVTLLEGMARHPDRFLANLPLLAPEDEAQLLREWNSTPVDFGELSCVHEQFARAAARQPDALALSDEHHSLTYGELDERANKLAARLQSLGAAPGTVVGVCLPPSVDLPVALLAVLKAGAAYLPMDPAYPAERLGFMVGDAGIRLLVTERKLASLFPTGSTRLVHLDAPGIPGTEAALPAAPALEATAYLIYTSGSTGVPKGVPIRHRSLANLVAWHQQAYAVTPADRATQLASPAFDACVWELWPYLTAGASVHIPTAEVRVSPERLVRWLADRRITLSFIPTPLAEALLDETWPAETALRAILTGGDRLRRWPGRRLPCPLYNHYGPTESTVVATCALVPAEPDGYAAPAIGRPIANIDVYVLDSHRQAVPIGVPGELYLGGAGLADGYHGRGDLSAEKFVPDLFDHLGESKLYRTGDLVRWRDDRQLDYLGRIDQQVKIRGHRIEPGEIEAALNEHPAVRESLVLACADALGQPQLAAYYLLRPGATEPTAATLSTALHRRLPAYMVPASFVSLEAWPLTVHGKLDRSRLPAPASSAAAETVAPRPGLETTIAHVWSEVLGCPRPGAYDDFFALGGHSLRAAQVVARLNALVPVALTVRHLFEHSTIAGLATFIEQAARTEDKPAPRVEVALAAQT
ncbi:MAG TPA: amino acid adenylation domain-containing protein [Lacunisphaera sp.]|nr:amino acid adenylation domain-containing protein [Lacunisphaera sp.]